MNRSSATQPNQYEGGGTKTVSMFSKLVSQGSSFVMEGVKNLVVKRHVSLKIHFVVSFMLIASFAIFVLQNLPVTKITEQLMECRAGNDNDDYLYLDPKLLKRGDTMPKTRAPFQDAVVFIVGGGNYIEYQNLVDFIKVTIRLISTLPCITESVFLSFGMNSKSKRPTRQNE